MGGTECGVQSFPGNLIISFPYLKPFSELHHCLQDEVQFLTVEDNLCGLICPAFPCILPELLSVPTKPGSQLQAFVHWCLVLSTLPTH